MLARRTLVVLTACLAALAMSAALAGAAKTPTYHVYKKCKDKYNCTGAAYLNAKQTRVITVSATVYCSDKSYVSASFSGSGKVSSKGKFEVTSDVSNWDVTNQVSVKGKATLSGKVKKKDKVTLNWSVDKAPSACPTSGKLTLKYKGTQKGG